MLKLLLCLCLPLLCVLLAWLFVRKYRQRRDFYYQLSLFNERLYNEVSYTRAPLPAFIEKYGFSGDFKKLLEQKKQCGFGGGEHAIPYLRKEEQNYLADYFKMIGKSDAASQKSYLAARRQEVEERRRSSEEAYKKHFSLYMKLGVLAGLILVILII